MNGNFSFGDYFKKEAIAFAWEFLTSPQDQGGLGFDPQDLWVTVYKDDEESIGIWREVADIPLERIQKRGMEDNFWSTGQPGPSGPCSEIYYDRGPAYGREGGPVEDEDRYIEIWNLVFMQYERGAGGGKDGYPILGELPKKNIDTGIGLERVAFLMQGVENLYEIDEVRPVLDLAAKLAPLPESKKRKVGGGIGSMMGGASFTIPSPPSTSSISPVDWFLTGIPPFECERP
jgi:alanyl-tRNA synthetase